VPSFSVCGLFSVITQFSLIYCFVISEVPACKGVKRKTNIKCEELFIYFSFSFLYTQQCQLLPSMFCVPFVTNVRSFKLRMHGENIMLTWPHINQKSKWVATGQTEEWMQDTRRKRMRNQVLPSRHSTSHCSFYPFDPVLKILSFIWLHLFYSYSTGGQTHRLRSPMKCADDQPFCVLAI
jgi:hypothetical protein